MNATMTTVTSCSFCTKPETEVQKMIAGPGVHICNECVALCGQILIDDKPVGDDTSIPYWRSMTDDEILELLPRVATVATQVEDNLRVWVQRLRDRGVSWARIGGALGMARQSAWERFSGED